MKCNNCGKEQTWLELIGTDFICKVCIQKHKIMGNIFRTHTDTFRYVLKKMAIKNFQEYMAIERKQLEPMVDFKRIGVKVATTNVVELE
jgi:hypothetical protein